MHRGLRLVGILAFAACSAPEPYAIPGLSTDEVSRPFEALGFGCIETQPGIDRGWSLECDSSGGPTATATGGGSGQIRYLHAGGDPSLPETLTWLEALASVRYQGADPEAAASWVRSHVHDPSCESTDTHPTECSIIIGEARLTLEWDLRGLEVGGPPDVSLHIARKDNPIH